MSCVNSHIAEVDAESFYVQRYFDLLIQTMQTGRRTFGFEYEFLPEKICTIENVETVTRFLLELGANREGQDLVFSNRMRVSFEPGGQLEYRSPPLYPEDQSTLDALIAFIDATNQAIRSATGIRYIGTGYMPGRGDAPLCLTTPRYIQLHRRLGISGTRGHEMMKGTAALHFHAAICGIDDILSVYEKLCRMSAEKIFQMSSERRDIWNHTDPTRCGSSPYCRESAATPKELIQGMVSFAMNAVALGEDVPFKASSSRSFDSFLYHMTTLFTDIRFNMKGPTLELRTPDSVPVEQFKSRWIHFIEQF